MEEVTVLKALEFAEYMATAAEEAITALNQHGIAIEAFEYAEESAIADAEYAVDSASERVTESLRRLRSAIYEFRKRVPQKPNVAVQPPVLRSAGTQG